MPLVSRDIWGRGIKHSNCSRNRPQHRLQSRAINTREMKRTNKTPHLLVIQRFGPCAVREGPLKAGKLDARAQVGHSSGVYQTHRPPGSIGIINVPDRRMEVVFDGRMYSLPDDASPLSWTVHWHAGEGLKYPAPLSPANNA